MTTIYLSPLNSIFVEALILKFIVCEAVLCAHTVEMGVATPRPGTGVRAIMESVPFCDNENLKFILSGERAHSLTHTHSHT